jgi:allantoate deiminase
MTAIDEAVRAAAQFGATPEAGVTRFAWSPPLFDVYAWLRERATEAGFASEVDAAGNLRVVWEAGDGPAVAVGSHLDTVPSGGRLDGALGVLSGFEAMQLLRKRGFRPSRPIWLLAFMDEEGARFGTSLFGSRAFAGEDVRALGERIDADGTTLRDAMAQAGYDLDRTHEAAGIGRVGRYLELHIEQGPVLERTGDEIGVVSAICGIVGLHVRLIGEANHAGTTPMEMRRDALVGAARCVVALHDEMLRRDGAVGTVGTVEALPGGSNVVPGTAAFTIDIRAERPAELEALEAWVRETVATIASAAALEAEIEARYRLAPAPMADGLVALLGRAAVAEGARMRVMPSGAGHDAMAIAPHVPSGMLFVPSRGGISHNPEWTDPQHCDLGVRVLARAIGELAG